MTDKALQALVAQWKSRLRLDDWHVTAEYVRFADLPGMNGNVLYDARRRRAHIKIVEAGQRDGDHINEEPTECIVVHELLHLHLASLEYDSGSVDDLTLEQGIHAVAEAFVRLANPDWTGHPG